MAATKKKLSSTSLCTVFLSFKSLLVFIYELIYALIYKLSGKSMIAQSVAIKSKQYTNSMNIDQNGNGNISKVPRLKEISEMPGPRSFPFFGTLLTSSGLQSSDIFTANQVNSTKYGSIVKEEHFWNIPLVFLYNAEDMKKVIKINPLMRPGMEILTMYRTLHPDRYNTFGLVNSQGETWKKLQSIFSAITSNIAFVRTMLEVHNDIAADVIDTLAGETGGPTTALPKAVNKLITEASFYTVLGKRMGFVGKKVGDIEKLNLFSNCHDMYWRAFHKSMYGFPWWKYFSTKTWREFTAAEDKLMKMMSEITEEMLSTNSASGVLAACRKDLVTRQDLNVVCLELVTGATEPVYHALLLTLYWISKHDEVYEKILEELREQLPTKDSPVDEFTLDNLPYLKACVTETFRINPPTVNVARILEEEVELGDYRLPPYTVVIMQTWHACLSEENFYRAKEYLPERWLLQDGVPPFKPHERSVLNQFGIGTRSCPGRKIAPQLMHVFLAKLLRKYKVKFTQEITQRYEWLMCVKDPVYVELQENEF